MKNSLLTLASALLLACGAAPTSPQDAFLGPLLAAESAARGDALWPGFRPFFMPTLIEFGEGAPAVSVVEGVPAPARATGMPWGLHAHGGRETFVWNATGRQEGGADPSVFAHEAFHEFARARLRLSPRPDGAAEPPSAGAFDELVLLAKALGGGTGWEEHARGFSALRARRREHMPELSARWEDWKEALEGTAVFAACRLRAMGSPEPRKSLTLCARARLFQAASDPRWGSVFRFHASGAAQAVLLEAAGVRAWKERVGAGAPLFAEFERRFPPASGAVAQEEAGPSPYGGLRVHEALKAARPAVESAWPAFRPYDFPFEAVVSTEGTASLPSIEARQPDKGPALLVLTLAPDYPAAAVELFAHEAFHLHQARTGWHRPGAEPPREPRPLSPEQAIGRRLEGLALAEALLGGEGWEERARDFTALRAERSQFGSPAEARWELRQERIEGTAEYVGILARGAGTSPASAPGPAFAGTLSLLLRPADPTPARSPWNHAAGAAQCALLDRKGTMWRARVEAGEDLFSVFSAAFPGRPREARIQAFERRMGRYALRAEPSW